MHTPTVTDIRRSNRLTVLRHLYALQKASRLQLVEQSGLSTATVSNVVNDLIDARIVAETGYAESQVGRPRAILAINAQSGYFVGIDVAETYIHFELFDLQLNFLHSVEHRLDAEENQPEQVADHLALGLKELIQVAGVKQANVLGVGVSLPGLVERSGGVSVFAPNWGWRNVSLADLLRARINLPLYVDNPLKAAAVAQLWFGAGRTADNLIVLNIGTGVGAGIVINGQLFRGTGNGAGEWGHTTLALEGRACRCGSNGCVEAYVGAPGIIQHLREVAPDSPILGAGRQPELLETLAVAAAQGDPAANEALDRTARYLGAGVANLLNLFNPSVIVVGGWVGDLLGPQLLPRLEPIVARYALVQMVTSVRIEPNLLSHNPVSLGAATFALEGHLTSLDKPARLTKP